MMIGFQGLRSLQRGELVGGPRQLVRVHPRYAEERAELESLVPIFAERCRAALARHGERVREAQFTLHRVSDLVTALFIAGAVLARATADEERGIDDRERDRAHLACRRAFKDFQRTLLETDHPDDALIERVARA
jgi:hypothetical protein